MSTEESSETPSSGLVLGPSGYYPPVYIAAIVSVSIAAFVIYRHLFKSTSGGAAAAGPTYILAGPSGSGKTALYTLVQYAIFLLKCERLTCRFGNSYDMARKHLHYLQLNKT